MYCGVELPEGTVFSVCPICGKKIWGEKMFNTIVKNMENAKKEGNLCHNFTPENKEKIGF